MGLDIGHDDMVVSFKAGVWTKMKYHSSWDWLMPVVEKIEHTSAYVNVKGCHVKISTWVDVNAPTKLEAVHKAVVEFIKWYNEQKH